MRWTGTQDRDSVDTLLPVAAAELTTQGRRPVPDAARRRHRPRRGRLRAGRRRTARRLGGRRDVTVVVPTGSGGTLAGLVAGHRLLGRPWTLAGARPAGHRGPPRARSRPWPASACAFGTNEEPGPGDITIADARGPGHGMPSLAGRAAAEEAMRTEGLMLDPVYTAKALALAPPGRNVVFWHTGGVLDAVAKAQDTKTGERS